MKKMKSQSNMKRIYSILAAALLSTALFAQPSEVKGTVTDIDGKPLQGVEVSDGYHVVVTDAEGKYCFPRIPEAYFVWVSVPAEYEIPIRQGHPCFYKKLIDDKRYDFALKPLKHGAEKNFNLFLIADPQCQRVSHVDRLRNEGISDLRSYSRKFHGPCYGMTLGDIGYSEGYRNTNYLLPIIREEMRAEKVGFPIFQTVGNHDFEYDLAATEPASPTITLRRNRIYESVFGPVDYSFDRGDVHFISMNDVCFETFGYPGKYHGDFSDAQLKWFLADLALVPADKLVLLTVHIPFEGHIKNSPNMQKVLAALGEREHAMIASGHTHTIKHLSYPCGVKEYVAGAMSGCWWWSKNCADGAPNGYAVWTFKGNELVGEIYKGQNFSDKYQMRVYRGDACFGGKYETFQLEHGHDVLLINAWNADERWKIEVYENGKCCGEAVKMALSSEFKAPYNGGKDWWAIGYNVGVVGRGHAKGSTRNNYCSKNYHMYKYTMNDPSAKVKVVATDAYGRKFVCTEIIEGAGQYGELAAPPTRKTDPVWR